MRVGKLLRALGILGQPAITQKARNADMTRARPWCRVNYAIVSSDAWKAEFVGAVRKATDTRTEGGAEEREERLKSDEPDQV